MNTQEKLATIAAAAIESNIRYGSLGDLLLAAEAADLKPGQLPDWLQEQRTEHPGWFNDQAKPETPTTPTTPPTLAGEENPWAKDNWNMTKQGDFLKKYGTEKATQMAKLAGTTIGGLRPQKAPPTPTAPITPTTPSGEPNPFSHEHWNMTKQGDFLKKHGTEKAEQMARAAGTTIGGRRPAQPAR